MQGKIQNMRISKLQMILCCVIGFGFGFEEVAQAGAGNGKRIVNRTVQMAPSPAPDSSKQAAEKELGKRAVNLRPVSSNSSK